MPALRPLWKRRERDTPPVWPCNKISECPSRTPARGPPHLGPDAAAPPVPASVPAPASYPLICQFLPLHDRYTCFSCSFHSSSSMLLPHFHAHVCTFNLYTILFFPLLSSFTILSLSVLIRPTSFSSFYLLNPFPAPIFSTPPRNFYSPPI